MSLTLVEALGQVDLEEGQFYRCQVKGHWVELRVLGPVEVRPSTASTNPMSCWTRGLSCRCPRRLRASEALTGRCLYLTLRKFRPMRMNLDLSCSACRGGTP